MSAYTHTHVMHVTEVSPYTQVSILNDFPGAPIVLDRDRRQRPYGLTWHNLVVNLLAADGGKTDVVATSRFRLVGPRIVAPGPGVKVGGSSAGGGAVGGGGRGGAGGVDGKLVRRAKFPEARAKVCFAFMSCGRLGLLRQTVGALVEHMDQWEPSVPYELAWVDQGSGPEARGIVEEVQFEHSLLWQLNYGVTHGLNMLLFGLCQQAEFAVTMEEDWLWNAGKMHVPAISMAMAVLDADPKVAGVFLRSVVQFGHETSSVGPWLTLAFDGAHLPGWARMDADDADYAGTHAMNRTHARSDAGAGAYDRIEYRHMCQKAGAWGAWTNGAAIWSRRRLARLVGQLNEDWGDAAELEYATRVGAVLCAAQIRTAPGCDSSLCNAVADHIGDKRTPAWAPEIQYHGNGHYSCTSYGRQLDGAACERLLHATA